MSRHDEFDAADVRYVIDAQAATDNADQYRPDPSAARREGDRRQRDEDRRARRR